MTLPYHPHLESPSLGLFNLKHSFFAWMCVLLMGLASAVQAESPQSTYLQSLSRVGAVYIGPQPDASALSELKADGIQTVISFRTPEEMAELPFDQEQILQADGIRYVLIPTGGEQTPIGAAQVRQLEALMNNSEGPIVMHCRSGYRAGIVFAAWLNSTHHLPLQDVIDAIGDTRITVDAVNPLLEPDDRTRP